MRGSQVKWLIALARAAQFQVQVFPAGAAGEEVIDTEIAEETPILHRLAALMFQDLLQHIVDANHVLEGLVLVLLGRPGDVSGKGRRSCGDPLANGLDVGPAEAWLPGGRHHRIVVGRDQLEQRRRLRLAGNNLVFAIHEQVMVEDLDAGIGLAAAMTFEATAAKDRLDPGGQGTGGNGRLRRGGLGLW